MTVLHYHTDTILVTGNAFTEFSVIRCYEKLSFSEIADGLINNTPRNPMEELDINSAFPKNVVLWCFYEGDLDLVERYFQEHSIKYGPTGHMGRHTGYREFMTAGNIRDRYEYYCVAGVTVNFLCESRERLEELMEDLRKSRVKFLYKDKIKIIR